MKRIRLEELPEILTPEIVDILAEMANEIPESEEWQQICLTLPYNDFRKVMDKKIILQQEREKRRKEALTEEDRKEEEEKIRKALENADPRGFYGNMGQPETVQEYKARYGVYPPGYDENVNKID